MGKLISRNKIITHYKQFFGLQEMGLAEGDHLMIDWAESLIEACVGKDAQTSEKDLRVCEVSVSVLHSIREAVANYMYSEGCSCCRDVDAHKEHTQKLAELLDVEPYSDNSGFDFSKYRCTGR